MTQENATGYTVIPQGPSRGEATAGADYKKEIVMIDVHAESSATGPSGRTPRDETVLGITAGEKRGKGL